MAPRHRVASTLAVAAIALLRYADGMLTIWHNPRCSKSRAALAILEGAGVELQVVEYLKNPPSAARLREVLKLLAVEPRALVRKGEAPYRELGLADADEARLIEAMAAHPILIERPVIIAAERAVIGRPPERARELIE